MRTLGFVGIALLTGCAALANTPKQDVIYAAWAKCRAEGRVDLNVRLQRVEPDGSYWWEGNSMQGVGAANACIAEEAPKILRDAKR